MRRWSRTTKPRNGSAQRLPVGAAKSAKSRAELQVSRARTAAVPPTSWFCTAQASCACTRPALPAAAAAPQLKPELRGAAAPSQTWSPNAPDTAALQGTLAGSGHCLLHTPSSHPHSGVYVPRLGVAEHRGLRALAWEEGPTLGGREPRSELPTPAPPG